MNSEPFILIFFPIKQFLCFYFLFVDCKITRVTRTGSWFPSSSGIRRPLLAHSCHGYFHQARHKAFLSHQEFDAVLGFCGLLYITGVREGLLSSASKASRVFVDADKQANPKMHADMQRTPLKRSWKRTLLRDSCFWLQNFPQSYRDHRATAIVIV